VSIFLLITLVVAGLSCTRVDEPKEKAPAEKAASAEAEKPAVEGEKKAEPTIAGEVRRTNLYWGDTHLHTSYSPDAFLMQNRSADPDTAYRYAKGYPVIHPFHRARIQIGTPLDFLVVSDHGEYMGVVPKILQGDPLVANTEAGKRFRKLADEGKELEAFAELIAQVNAGTPDPDFISPEINRTVWGEIMDAAERHNEPGKFTTFLGWEWSSTPGGANLHRVIFIREGKEKGKEFIPYTSLDSSKPEQLWKWLKTTSEKTGTTFIAIPHNSNISKGLMFPLMDSEGNPISKQYAEDRMRWEPVVEMTQIKGDSETHPSITPTDEFADYETYEHIIAVGEHVEKPKADEGDYARSALKRGLTIEAKTGANPYKFGMIGSTDSHTAMASAEEDNFHGKMAQDSTPEMKSKDIIPGANGFDMSAAGLVAVWAEENTRESLFDAFRRKEVYATTGPRIQVRLFGGWDYTPEDAEAADPAETGYRKGVPMGGELGRAPKGKAPSFLISAIKDPNHANLDRVQVIKGWVDKEGMPQEKIYDVALSDGRNVSEDGSVKPVGNTVNLKTATWTDTIGDAQLATVWTDPDFDPAVSAFYYVRVLQIPTPRHSLYDAIALGIDPKETGHPATIQERAYTSPIWYSPQEKTKSSEKE
jgi:hypothetical protein